MHNFLKGRLILVRLVLLAAVLCLVGIGTASIYSVGNPAHAGIANQGGSFAILSVKWEKQLQYVFAGILGLIAVNLINYRRLGAVSYWIYGFVLILLVVLLAGKVVELSFVPLINGTHRWIKLHPNLPRIQPSEFCKLAYIVALAWYLRYRSNYRKFGALIGPFGLTVLPMILILLEPDLGTVMLMMPVLFVMLFVAGAKGRHLLIIILLAVMVSPLLWCFMERYQRKRISCVLLQNEKIRQAAIEHPKFAEILVGGGSKFTEKTWKSDYGYHLIRSKYAIASGGMRGYGFRKGPFIKYNFLDARETDFIFAIIGHQWGFIGCLVVLGLYLIIVMCGLEIAANNTDPFGKLLAIGIVTMFVVEVSVNISMTLGLMPITGLTLPLVSYGGSSLVVSLMAIGLLNNVGRCRPFSVAKKPFE